MESFSVTLKGGAPWGFSIQGGLDHRSPLRVGKVTSGGRASNAGLLAGDYILSINGEDCKHLKHLQAQQLIKKSVDSVTLVCTKVRPGITSPALSQTFTFSSKERKDAPTQQPVVKLLQSIPKPEPPQVSNNVNSSTVKALDDSATCTSASATSSLPHHADVNFQDNASKSKDNGGGHAPDSCDGPGDRSNGCQQSDLGKVAHSEVMDCGSATVIQFTRLTKDALASAITQAAANRVRRESSGEREGPSTDLPVKEQPALQVYLGEMPSAYDLSSTSSVVEEPVIQVQHSDESMVYQFDSKPEGSASLSVSAPSTDPPSTEKPVCHVENADQPTKCTSDENESVVEESASCLDQAQPEPLMYTFNTLSNNETQDAPVGKSSKPIMNFEPSAVIKREEEAVAVVNKDPGWYKQVSQQAQDTVEEDSPEEKDKDHQELDTKRRMSQEDTTPLLQRSATGSDYKHSMEHMHPLLSDNAEERFNQHNITKVTSDDQPKLLDRIDASKLHEALNTASVLRQFEQEGVPSRLLPALVQAQKESEVSAAKKNVEKPPPGQKVKALFDFCAQGSRELSFKKGDYLDLHHTVDENWFEASLGSSRGIIPHKYVQAVKVK